MIPPNMTKDFAKQHAVDLQRMGSAGRPLRWPWPHGWRLRHEGRRLPTHLWRLRSTTLQRIPTRWGRRIVATADGKPCPS
jgi:hypothetical protein